MPEACAFWLTHYLGAAREQTRHASRSCPPHIIFLFNIVMVCWRNIYGLIFSEHSSKAAIYGLLPWRDWQVSKVTYNGSSGLLFNPTKWLDGLIDIHYTYPYAGRKRLI